MFKALQKIFCPLSKISVNDQTQANSLSPSVQLNFSWSLEMSDRQNDRLARPSECLSSSPGATRHHPEPPLKVILSK